MKLKLTLVVGALVIAGAAFIGIRFYSFVFAKNLKGEIIGIERVTQTSAIVGNTSNVPTSQFYSFAVAIKNVDGEIYTASTEDRQWAVAQKGQCVEAKFFVYPPWDLDKAGTYFNARLVRLYECAGNK